MSAQMVFISSTFLEFKEERRVLHKILTRFLPVACEIADYLTCDTPNLEAELKKWINKADIIIILLGVRYGSTVKKISWTEKEVRYAKNRNKRILPYMKKQKPPSEILDLDEKKQKALERFVRFIEKEISASIPRFSNNPELIALAVRDILNVIEILQRENYDDGFL